jgi:hypothetical protein
MNVDFTKYKRFFAFGCSFTCYIWPTWADVVSKEMPQAEFFNLGKTGAGNLCISSKVAEANNRFKFTDTDLVMVMFSSYTREDRWVEHEWVTHGNVFVNEVYPKDWVRKFADERGYLIRDASLIDLTNRYLKSLECDSFTMLSVPFTTNSDSPTHESIAPNDILEVYADTFNNMSPSFFELELDGWDTDYKKFEDGHPSTIKYYNYLEKIGFKFSESTKQYALDSTQILIEEDSRALVQTRFPDQDRNTTISQNTLF